MSTVEPTIKENVKTSQFWSGLLAFPFAALFYLIVFFGLLGLLGIASHWARLQWS